MVKKSVGNFFYNRVLYYMRESEKSFILPRTPSNRKSYNLIPVVCV